MLSAFEKLALHRKQYFARPISDEAIVQRADKARRCDNENPETNPRLKCNWPPAGPAVTRPQGPQCQSHQSRLAIQHQKCPHQTQASVPFNLTKSAD